VVAVVVVTMTVVVAMMEAEMTGSARAMVRMTGCAITRAAFGKFDRGTHPDSASPRTSIERFVAPTVFRVVAGMGWERARSARCSAIFVDVAFAFPEGGGSSFALVVLLMGSGRCSASIMVWRSLVARFAWLTRVRMRRGRCSS
jgi:hypothetical protein